MSGDLMIRECAGYGERQRPLAITDQGVVRTFTVVHKASDPWFAGRVPYGIVVADLGDGIRLTGNYLGDDLGALACGLPVQARYSGTEGRAFLGWAPR